MMNLCNYLSPQTIIVAPKGHAKQDIMRQLVSALAEYHHLKQPKRIYHAIVERERAGSTFLPLGVAIPHARLAGIAEIKMVLGILPDGIEEAIDGQLFRIHLVCLFVSPLQEEEFGRHLKLLAHIAALFRDEQIVQQLAKCGSSGTAFALLQKIERAHAESHEPPASV
ncbi:MAG: PTS sugar transporter subunit IIA [Deltaproteobacteria bacterium]|nr:PTS sugar transporter subunit IIA [Deltaproteobacteria bacterium]